jgi:hypothetical protein
VLHCSAFFRTVKFGPINCGKKRNATIVGYLIEGMKITRELTLYQLRKIGWKKLSSRQSLNFLKTRPWFTPFSMLLTQVPLGGGDLWLVS